MSSKALLIAGLGSQSVGGCVRCIRTIRPWNLVRERSPERSSRHCATGRVARAARWFQTKFKGDVFYAVKANPSHMVSRP